MWFAAFALAQAVGPADPDSVVRDCPQGEEGEIVVCGDQPDDRYRVAPAFRGPPPINRQGDRTVIRERMRWVEGDPMDYMGYCTAVGPNGWQGCMFEDWKRQRQERKGMAY